MAQLDDIPGIGFIAAQEIIAEIGTDMSRFPTAGHLVSWAKFAPKARQSAGRAKAATTGEGNPWLGGTLGEAAISAARTSTFLASRYKRIVKRRGRKRALVVRGQFHPHHRLAPAVRPRRPLHRPRPLLARPPSPAPAKTQLIAELERLSGMKVTLQQSA
ncbi:MAG TPA: IS110 family transposase [Streptosporangiaceae bacterium]